MSITDEILQTELPAKPLMLSRLGAEMEKDDPDFMRVSELIAPTSALLGRGEDRQLSLCRPGRHCFGAAGVSYLGLAEVFGVVTGRCWAQPRAIGAQMERLWTSPPDAPARWHGWRAGCVASTRRAYTCGLFEDCGMAVLLMRIRLRADADTDRAHVESVRYGARAQARSRGGQPGSDAGVGAAGRDRGGSGLHR